MLILPEFCNQILYHFRKNVSNADSRSRDMLHILGFHILRFRIYSFYWLFLAFVLWKAYWYNCYDILIKNSDCLLRMVIFCKNGFSNSIFFMHIWPYDFAILTLTCEVSPVFESGLSYVTYFTSQNIISQYGISKDLESTCV